MTDNINLNTLFPFKRNYLDRNGQKYHYLDEGNGEPVVMVHAKALGQLGIEKRTPPLITCR